MSESDTLAPTAAPPSYLTITDADSEWLLIGAILVFFMRACGVRARHACRASRVPSSPGRRARARIAEAGFAMLEVGSIQIKNTKNILVRMRARNTWIRVSGRLLTLTGRLFSLRKIADQERV